MCEEKPGVRGQLLNCGPPSTSLAVPKQSSRKGIFRLEEFLICKNCKCRFLVSLREDNKLLPGEELFLSVCPECNHEWSGRCPFCDQTLEVIWQTKVPCCLHCNRPLRPEAPGGKAANTSRTTWKHM